ncbi:hypothetical protein ACFX1Q_041922 [Malus domestica]
MSGGVGPTYNDITLSREQEQEQLQHELVKQSKTDPTSSKLKRFGVIPFWQINALAIIIVLSASGMQGRRQYMPSIGLGLLSLF